MIVGLLGEIPSLLCRRLNIPYIIMGLMVVVGKQ